MTRYLLDTNVISETARQNPNPNVITWIRQLPELVLPAIAVYEIAAGIKRAPAGKRRRFLEEWFADLLGAGCDVLALNRDAALASAEIEVEARRQGRSVEHRDLLILGTAKAHSLGIATKNVAHLHVEAPVVEPAAKRSAFDIALENLGNVVLDLSPQHRSYDLRRERLLHRRSAGR